MKWLNFLNGGKSKRPRQPIRTVQSPGQARAERLAREARQARARKPASATRQVRTTPGADDIDPIFADTGSLELTSDVVEGDNPYDTQTWRKDDDGRLRRVDDTAAIKNKAKRTPHKSADRSNPYDTIVGRKGW
jgi:hypothetical protein